MGNMTIAVIFVVVLNVLMFLAQAAMLDLNPEGPKFFNCQGTMLEDYDKNRCTGTPVLNVDVGSELPTAEGSISPTTGNLFTDTFSWVKRWFSNKINYIKQILSAPYNMLKYMGVPDTFRYAIGTMWYLITVFVIIAFFKGEG